MEIVTSLLEPKVLDKIAARPKGPLRRFMEMIREMRIELGREGTGFEPLLDFPRDI